MARELTIKITADGSQARRQLAETEQQIDKVTTATGNTDKAMTAMGLNTAKVIGAISAAFASAQIANKLNAAVDAASRIADQSAKLGISAEAVQRFAKAAELSGGSLNDIATAITRMNTNLVQGGKATEQVIADLGLDIDKLRKSKPEEAFVQIAEAIR